VKVFILKFALQTFLLTAVFHYIAKQRKNNKSEIDISNLFFFKEVDFGFW
jgi:hypothetical protein